MKGKKKTHNLLKTVKAYFSALDVIWIFFKSQFNFQNQTKVEFFSIQTIISMLFLFTINCSFKFCKNYEVCFPTHLSIFISFPLYKYITMMFQI